jgi:hypothetical protein
MEISEHLNVSYGSIQNILTTDFNMRWVSAKFVPHEFRVCGSVHPQIFNLTRCTINLIFIALSHRYRSTCFGHYCAHDQEPPPTAFAAAGYRVIAGVNMFPAVVGLLVNRPQLETRPHRQSHGNQRLQRQLEGAPDHGHNSARNMLSGVYATKQ